MSTLNQSPKLALFCKVVDNFGDIGICWRLARQLVDEHDIDVTLWVDDLRSFQRICPALRSDAVHQLMAGVTVRHWRDQEGVFTATEVADIVIEFFGCDLPPGYITAMTEKTPQPVWINLEGLSAEEWVEGCHTLSSPPRQSLLKYFFYPGFTSKTGGLLREAGLAQERRQFQSDSLAMAAFLASLGVTASEMATTKVSLFCYPQAPVAALLDAWQRSAHAVTCLVPEGVAQAAVEAFLAAPALPGAVKTQGALTVRVVPFLAQPAYDQLLWACDVNFVRGEDSFVRAQWAGRPFIWHIYAQDENLHHKKLRAFLQRYASDLASLTSFSLHWNEAATMGPDTAANISAEAVTNWPAQWAAFQAERGSMSRRAVDWEQQMAAHGDLGGNLLQFAAAVRRSP